MRTRFDRLISALFNNASLASTAEALRQLMDSLEQSCPEDPAPHTADLMIAARDELSNPVSQMSIPALALKLGYSERHFSRQFSDTFGMSPNAWRQNARIEMAKTRLRTGATVADAAEIAGFKNPSSFSRQYKQRTGITARAFAEQFRHPKQRGAP